MIIDIVILEAVIDDKNIAKDVIVQVANAIVSKEAVAGIDFLLKDLIAGHVIIVADIILEISALNHHSLKRIGHSEDAVIVETDQNHLVMDSRDMIVVSSVAEEMIEETLEAVIEVASEEEIVVDSEVGIAAVSVAMTVEVSEEEVTSGIMIEVNLEAVGTVADFGAVMIVAVLSVITIEAVSVVVEIEAATEVVSVAVVIEAASVAVVVVLVISKMMCQFSKVDSVMNRLSKLL